jgi:NAD(P) transhydrogenase
LTQAARRRDNDLARARDAAYSAAVATPADDFDLVVIGGGPAGERGAAQAAYFGKRVALIERAPEPGGAAVHTGTLPSKTLREAALFLSGYRQLDLYGVTVSVDPGVTVQKLLARKDVVRDTEVERIHRNLERHGIELVRGSARLVDAHTVELDDGSALSADAILVATGSTPHRPAGIPFEDDHVHDADGILGIDRLPSVLAVIGGGVIGCEYACMFAALGTEVHLLDPRPDLVPFLDREIVDRLTAAMRHLGVHVRVGEAVTSVVRAGAELVCQLADERSLVADTVLVASGRTGNTKGLGLEGLGVEVDRRGHVVVDGGFRTAVPSVFAAGDVIGFPALASTSMEQARVAVCTAFGFSYKRQVSDVLPYGIYTIPEVSCVGARETDVEDAVVGRATFGDNVRGQIVGDHEGMVKLVFDRAERRLIGCHCIGDHASELVHVGQAVMVLGGTVDTFIEIVFNHPTLSETFKYAAYDALGRWGARDPALAPFGDAP